MIGKTISHYKILEKLGEGGMGVVYKAEDTKLKRTVALKFLSPQALGSDEERSRFIHEAQAAASLNHPNICTVHEIDESEVHSFIAMEYVEGQSLKNKIGAGPMKLSDAVNLAIQVAEGLQKAHENKIVHRDIKPANVLLSLDGRAKIMDFGLAKSAGRTLLTKEGTTLGTVAYMSPEQARGEDADSRTDIWSLGAILYEMVAGRRPFEGDYEPAILYSILNQIQEPLTALRTGVPMELERIVNKCLSKDKSERYQTAADLVADLKHLNRSLDSADMESRPGLSSVSDRRSSRAWLWAFGVVAIVIIAVFAARHYLGPSGGVGEGPTTSEGPSERKMLVVLPFENLGAPEDEYFACGITEELTSRLAALQGLGVISRTSAFQYKGAGKTIKQIGEELGVGYVLEGTVRWDRVPDGGSRVRVTPQLIRVSDDTHLWSQRYDRELQDIFAVQSQIAEQVIDQLDVALMGARRKTLEDRPTDNMEAYQAYLRGMEHINVPDVPHESALAALAMFKRAVELDPEFALAYTKLSWVYSRMYHTFQDRSDSCLANAKAAVDEALRLQPELPEARAALGMYFYWGLRDYDRALVELAVAEQGLPNSAEIIQAVGYIHRRQGKFESALEKIKKAFELNPQDADLAMEVAGTCAALRRHADAIEYCDRAIFIRPDYAGAHAWKAVFLMHGFGDLEGSRAVLEGIPATTDMIGSLVWLLQFAYERNYEALLVGVQSIPVEYIDAGVLAFSKSLLLGSLYDWGLEQPEVARPYFETAQALLEQRVAEMPEDYRIRSLLGVAYAGLGRKDDAIREGKKAVELCPLTKDALDGPNRLRDLAEIYAVVGEHDAALDILEQLIEIPAGLTVNNLRLSYSWDPLREHPRFQQLLEKYSESGP